MAKYRLKSAHYLDGDIYLPGDTELAHLGDDKGTIVGDGTKYTVKWPTLEMEPLDDEARAALKKERERLRLNHATMTPVEDIAMDQYEREYVPGFNVRRGEPRPDGSPIASVAVVKK